MNKVAFVTGASRGIGRETALAFARAGFDLAISARSVDEGGLTWGIISATKHSDLALVNTTATRTVIIMGQASQSELQQFAASLK